MWTSMAKRQYQPVDVQTRFLRLRQPAALADRIEGWTVCWLGGWEKGKDGVRGAPAAAIEESGLKVIVVDDDGAVARKERSRTQLVPHAPFLANGSRPSRSAILHRELLR